MKTKKYLKKIAFAFGLFAIGLYLAPASALAGVPAGAVYNSDTGTFGVCVGALCDSGNSGSGGGFALSNAYGLPEGSLLGIASNLLFWLLTVFAIFGIIGFVLSGIFYLLAGADEGNAEKGKDGMKWSIIGIVVGLSGFIIMQAVNALLGGMSKNF